MKSKILNAFLTMLPTLIFLGLGAATVSGQGLITLLPTNTTFTTAQSQDIAKIANDARTADYRLVQLGSFASNQTNGFLSFAIPGMEASTFIGRIEMVETDNSQGEFWSGTIEGYPGSYFTFGSNPYSSGGYVQLQNNFYSLLPIGGNKCILMKHKQSAYNSEGCFQDEESPVGLEIDECEEDYETCPATIDILLLITPEARAYLNGFDFWGLAIFSGLVNSSINIAFQNSDIPNKQVRIRAVENFVLAAGYSAPPDIDVDTDNLVSDLNAQTLRNQYRADIVVMLTNQGYFTGGGGQIFGNVAQINASNANAYTVIEIPFMIAPRQTFPHEIGHLFGARHNRSDNGGNDDTDVCAHARRFNDGDDVERRTILAGLGAVANNPFSGEGRILHYSNPDVDFNGAATGTNNNDNAKAIRNTGCAIGAYQPSPFMSAAIIGQSLFCKHGLEQPQTYEAAVLPGGTGMPGQAPFTYQWNWSPNPTFSPNYSLGSDPSITINDVLECPNFYLRLTVTSSDNVTAVRTRWISTDMCEECEGIHIVAPNEGLNGISAHESLAIKDNPVPHNPPANQGSISSHASPMLGLDASIYPNPSSGDPRLRFTLPEASEVQITVTSTDGREVESIHLYDQAVGENFVGLELESSPPGIYFCKILAGNLSRTLKVVLTE